MAHPRVAALSQQLGALPSFTAGGRQFTMFFIGVHEPTLPTERHYVVDFGARNTTESFRGQLLLGGDTFERDDVSALAVSTMKEIIEGRLPPGARQLL
ncbi:MAG TPA: hypothetical protein VLV86_19735 [Vicinamibacterales bacterium]|nr:hypothetical protein [Vicinamibacterales bacterium]